MADSQCKVVFFRDCIQRYSSHLMIRWMEEILHHLIGGKHPIIYRVSTCFNHPFGGFSDFAGPSTVVTFQLEMVFHPIATQRATRGPWNPWTGRSDFTPRPRRQPMLLIHLDINKFRGPDGKRGEGHFFYWGFWGLVHPRMQGASPHHWW